MSEFDEVWHVLQNTLKPGTEVKNWTAFRGCLGDAMTITEVQPLSISVSAPKAILIQIVPREDFERVWKVWQGYKTKFYRRTTLRDMTMFSKYIISIFHWYETEGQMMQPGG